MSMSRQLISSGSPLEKPIGFSRAVRIGSVIAEAGARLDDIIRTRIMLTDMSRWEEAARAHGELFSIIRPACTFVEVKGFIRSAWLVETEADAVILTATATVKD
jgi:enamine deaminase RidA (YjgF/YER057c/UK114 family)